MVVVASRPLPPGIPAEWSAARRLFEDVTRGLTCGDLLHVNSPTCTAGSLDMLVGCAWGSAKWFVPFYVIHVIWNGKKAISGDKKFYKELLHFYVRSVIFASTMGFTFSVAACLTVRLMRGFSFWTSVFIPGTIAGMSITLEHIYRRRIVMNTFYNMALQYLYLRAQIAQLVRRTAAGETVVFMAVNAALLYLLHEKRITSAFWFYIPETKIEEPIESLRRFTKRCHVPHRDSCFESAMKATAKYAGLSALIQVLRVLMSRGSAVVRNPTIFLRDFISWKTAVGITSIGGYVFLYKAARCALSHHYGSDESYHSALAGLAAGATYWLQPNSTYLTSAIIATIRLLHDYLPPRLRFIGQWPMPEFFFALCNGVLFHARCMDIANCPKFIIQMMDIGTQNRSRTIYNAYLQQVQKFQQSAR